MQTQTQALGEYIITRLPQKHNEEQTSQIVSITLDTEDKVDELCKEIKATLLKAHPESEATLNKINNQIKKLFSNNQDSYANLATKLREENYFNSIRDCLIYAFDTRLRDGSDIPSFFVTDQISPFVYAISYSNNFNNPQTLFHSKEKVSPEDVGVTQNDIESERKLGFH